MTQASFCAFCGASLQGGDAVFCGRCGRPVVTHRAPAPQAMTPPAQPWTAPTGPAPTAPATRIPQPSTIAEYPLAASTPLSRALALPRPARASILGLSLRVAIVFGVLEVAASLALMYAVLPATATWGGSLETVRDRTALAFYAATSLAALIAAFAASRAGRSRSLLLVLLAVGAGAAIAFAGLFCLPYARGGTVPLGPVITHAAAAAVGLLVGCLLGRPGGQRRTLRSMPAGLAVLLAVVLAVGHPAPARGASAADLITADDCSLNAIAGSIAAGVSIAGWEGGADFAFDASRHPGDSWRLAVTVGVEAGHSWDIGFPLIVGISVAAKGTVSVSNTYAFPSTAALKAALVKALTRTVATVQAPAALLMADPQVGANLLAALPVPSETEFDMGGKVEISGSAPLLASALQMAPPVAGGASVRDLAAGLQHFEGSFAAGAGFFVRAVNPANRNPIVTDPTELALGWRTDASGSASLAPLGTRSGGSGGGTTSVELGFSHELPPDLSDELGGLLGSLPGGILNGWYPSHLTLMATARGAQLKGAGVIWPGFDFSSSILALALQVEAHVDVELGLQVDSVARVGRVGSSEIAGAIGTVLLDLVSRLRDAQGQPVVTANVTRAQLAGAFNTLADNSAGFFSVSGVGRATAAARGGMGLGIDVGASMSADMELRALVAAARVDSGHVTQSPAGCKP